MTENQATVYYTVYSK